MAQVEALEACCSARSDEGPSSQNTSALKPSWRGDKSGPVKTVRVSPTVEYVDVALLSTSHATKFPQETENTSDVIGGTT